jgi:Ser/Thr protein kinase RdoA (MazF antagonist)
MDLHPLYSMPRLEDVARLVSRLYDVGEVTACALANRGFNDVYDLRTAGGDRFMLRIGNRRSRPDANLDYETAFLAHLDCCGVPVATAVATRAGEPWCRARLAEGERPTVLFRYLPGRVARRGETPDSFAQGRTLGQVHRAGESYGGPSSRLRLDTQHLIERPLAALLAQPTLEPADTEFISDLAARLAEQLDGIRGDLAWGNCHGDCHGHNARISESGALGRTAAFFDFDDGGPGWLAYDLAVYLWNKALVPGTMHLWPPFLQGYRSVSPLAPQDLDATLLFVPIRHIWLLGEYAGRAAEWGLDTISALWLSRQVDFLRAWEDDHLADRLL